MKRMLGYLCLVLVLIAGIAIWGYNSILAREETVDSSWSEVLNQYQRRAELIPGVVNAVKGYASHEKTLLESVTLARTQALKTTTQLKAAPDDAAAIEAWRTAQNQMSQSLRQLTIVSERYPDLKSHELFRDLMTQLEGTENRIAVARGRYITAIKEYNLSVRQFPGVIIAKQFGYQTKANYLPKDAEQIEQPPVIDFATGQ